MDPCRQIGIGTIGETALFALPGDPVAAQIAFEDFVRPALRKMAGWAELYRPTVTGRVTRGWNSPAGKMEFVRVRLTGDPTAGYMAEPQGEPGARLISALARSNALAVVPESKTVVRAGDRLPCFVLDDA